MSERASQGTGPGEESANREELLDRLAGALVATVCGGVSKLPRDAALSAGALLGRTLGRVLRARRDVALRNLRIAFPEWSEERRRALFVESCAHLGRSLVELATLGALPPEEVASLADVEGFEHAEAARKVLPSGGVVALTAHLGNWEILAAIMKTHDWPITVVKRGRDSALLDRVITRLRSEWGVELLTRGNAALAAVRAVRAGRFVGTPLDQNCGREEGAFVPFFDRLACTRDGPARLALYTGAPVLPVFTERSAVTGRHLVRIEEPLELVEAGEDREAAVEENVRRMTAAIEAAIRRTPEQWTWMHRRWHTQPAGVARPYLSKRRAKLIHT